MTNARNTTLSSSRRRVERDDVLLVCTDVRQLLAEVAQLSPNFNLIVDVAAVDPTDPDLLEVLRLVDAHVRTDGGRFRITHADEEMCALVRAHGLHELVPRQR